MKSIKSIVVIVLCVICFQGMVNVNAASKPEISVPINKVSFEKAKVKLQNGEVDFSIKAKNKSKGIAKKIELKYKVVVEYKDVKVVKPSMVAKSVEAIEKEEPAGLAETETVGVEATSQESTSNYVEPTTQASTTTAMQPTTQVATTASEQVVTTQQTTTQANATVQETVNETTTVEYQTITKTKTRTIYVTAKYKDLKKGKKATIKKSVKNKKITKDMVVKSVSLVQKKIYSKTGVVVFNAKNGEVKLRWGTEDKIAPKITGMIESDSYEGSDCYITIFADQKDYNFGKYIKAEDDRDGRVKINVNTDNVDWKKRGDYKLTITAVDKAGNKAKSWLKVHIEPKGTLCEMADDILDKIISDSWSEEKKLRAIYSYVQGHVSYVDSNKRYTWQEAAMNGVRYGYGSCFTYYSLSKLLISRIGIPNLEITRYPAAYGNHHWWNLVYTNGGWYHFDNTPRVRKSYLCLLTDDQLKASGHYSSIDQSKYPARAKKGI